MLDMNSSDDETFEQFYTDLRVLFNDCSDDHNIESEMLRDHIVFGVKLNKVQEKLIEQESELTFKNIQI